MKTPLRKIMNKAFCVLLAALLASSSAFAAPVAEDPDDDEESAPMPELPGREGDDSLLAEIVKNAAESMIRSQITDDVLGRLNKKIAKELGEKYSSLASDAMTVYSIGKGVDSYQKAKSEQQKYAAAMGVITDIMVLTGIGAPIAGTLKTVLMIQAVASAYIMKEGSKQAMQIYIQAGKVDMLTSRAQMRRAKGEFKFLRRLWTQSTVALQMAEVLTQQFKEKCSDLEKVADAKVLQGCLKDARGILFAYALGAQLLSDVMTAKLDFISIENFEELAKVPKGSLAQSADNLLRLSQNANVALTKAIEKIEQLQFEDSEVAMSRQLAPQAKTLACLRTTREFATPVLASIRHFDLQDPSDRVLVRLRVQEATQKLRLKCQDLTYLPPTTAQILARVDAELKAARKQLASKSARARIGKRL